MTNLVYAIKVNELIYSGLRVLDVKIGKTTNIKRTLTQYRRSGRGIDVLDLWQPNNDLTLSQCEVGVQSIAEKYAYSKQSEKFIFLQDGYDEFSDNVSKLLKKIGTDKIGAKEVIKKDMKKKSEIEWDDIVPELNYSFAQRGIELCKKIKKGDPSRRRFGGIRTKYEGFDWISLKFRKDCINVYLKGDFRGAKKHLQSKFKDKLEFNTWRDGYSFFVETESQFKDLVKWLKLN